MLKFTKKSLTLERIQLIIEIDNKIEQVLPADKDDVQITASMGSLFNWIVFLGFINGKRPYSTSSIS